MLKAILQNGVIVPLEPMPSEWEDGMSLDVVRSNSIIDVDDWAKQMNKLCADSLAEDEATVRRIIEEQRQESKAQMRRETRTSA